MKEPCTAGLLSFEGVRRDANFVPILSQATSQLGPTIGPRWTSRGRPAAGYYTKRTAEGWLSDVLDHARRGTLPGMVRTGATFADAAAEYLRWIEHDRAQAVNGARLPVDHHPHLLPAFGKKRLEDITTEGIERWAGGLTAAGG